MIKAKASKCPTDDLSLTNCVVVNPTDFQETVQYVLYNTISLLTSDIQFIVPRCRTILADRSISVVGPKWLPKDLKCIKLETDFRKKLKTHLFDRFYNDDGY